ncbi:MAG TPA: hypothetical protein VHF45_06460 [Thermoleophilaceae bacterium]|nr:hypothetical protein [Thermoleophilaceae bacterium]
MATRTIPAIGTPAARRAAMRASLVAYRLVALDELWTAEVDAAQGAPGEADLRELEELARELSDVLTESRDHAYELRMMLDEQVSDDAFTEALDAISESPAAPSDLLEMLVLSVPEYEPRSAVITACDYIRETADSESALLHEKLSALQSGGAAQGDVRMPFKCAALLMLVGGGAVASIGLGGAPLFVGMSVGSQVGLGALAWIEGKCPNLLAEIGFGRR